MERAWISPTTLPSHVPTCDARARQDSQLSMLDERTGSLEVVGRLHAQPEPVAEPAVPAKTKITTSVQ